MGNRRKILELGVTDRDWVGGGGETDHLVPYSSEVKSA